MRICKICLGHIDWNFSEEPEKGISLGLLSFSDGYSLDRGLIAVHLINGKWSIDLFFFHLVVANGWIFAK